MEVVSFWRNAPELVHNYCPLCITFATFSNASQESTTKAVKFSHWDQHGETLAIFDLPTGKLLQSFTFAENSYYIHTELPERFARFGFRADTVRLINADDTEYRLSNTYFRLVHSDSRVFLLIKKHLHPASLMPKSSNLPTYTLSSTSTTASRSKTLWWTKWLFPSAAVNPSRPPD